MNCLSIRSDEGYNRKSRIVHGRVRKRVREMGFPLSQQTAVRPDAISSLGTHSVSLQPIALLLQQSLASSIPTDQGTANYL